MSQRVSRFIRRGVFTRPYVPPIDMSAVVIELPRTAETPLSIAALATVPSGNRVTVTIPAGCPIQLRYTPEA